MLQLTVSTPTLALGVVVIPCCVALVLCAYMLRVGGGRTASNASLDPAVSCPHVRCNATYPDSVRAYESSRRRWMEKHAGSADVHARVCLSSCSECAVRFGMTAAERYVRDVAGKVNVDLGVEPLRPLDGRAARTIAAPSSSAPSSSSTPASMSSAASTPNYGAGRGRKPVGEAAVALGLVDRMSLVLRQFPPHSPVRADIVDTLIDEDENISEQCALLGIPDRTYRYWRATRENRAEAIDAIPGPSHLRRARKTAP